MNIQDLKYIIEVERSGSINRAADNLFMAQSNLSRSVKEIEKELGITIFKRNPKGIVVTEQGAIFLNHAKAILAELTNIENIGKAAEHRMLSFNISIPRASYITYAFTEFVKQIDCSEGICMSFKETNAEEAIDKIVERENNLGIIRYQNTYEEYFISLLEEKDIRYQTIWEFEYLVLMSKEHPLAQYKEIPYHSLGEYVEVVNGDNSVPQFSVSHLRMDKVDNEKKSICIYDRGSQFDLLSRVHTTYMWVSPMPQEMLDQYGLVQRKCNISYKINKDVLIYLNNYKLTDLDKKFILELNMVQANMAKIYEVQ